ncbi:dehydrodolichyl diphosphate synthase complex subunit Nus1 [Anopheles bellator]|uniref:dehydrodolichyl diphosphate synthase complex subunit Nus1 n=1 Tax=Anopheles bellator TaxID=139047 RepID=UPI00264A067B|nr:dehydrodolichyl diphosphate synthase complex subunit Nus1 [Anopheles bellator]
MMHSHKTMTTAMNPLITAIWSLLHILFTCSEWLAWLSRWCRQTVFHCLRIRSQFTVEKYHHFVRQSQTFVRQNMTQVTKVPVHLVVLLGLEEPDYRLLTQLIFWSHAAGIRYISFYDHNGVIKRNHEQMVRYVNAAHLDDADDICWTSEAPTKSESRPGRPTPTTVSFYSPVDGKQGLVQLGRLVGESLRNRNLQISDVDIEFLNGRLQAAHNHIPDPDLALYFGDICSPYGLLPWQIRLTEFLSLALRLRDVSVRHFMNCLLKFARCEQRFGT